MNKALLQLEQLRVSYGHVEAVKGVSLEVHPGEIVALVGANGAGKSTTLLALSGLIRLVSGRVVWESQDITRWSPHQRVSGGLVQVAEGRAILKTLTVRENLELGSYTQPGQADLKPIYERFPILKQRASQLAGNLSGGEQQMLAIGRALMSRPRLLLLDEPSMGLAPLMVQKIYETIQAVAREGMTILLVEQNAHLALQVSQRGYVMESGAITLAGPSAELAADPQVRVAYLGE